MKLVLNVTAGPHQGKEFTFDRHDTFLVDDLRAYGPELARAGARDTPIPMIALQAIRDSAPPGKAERDAYFRADDLRADVGPVLEEVRKRHPASPIGASAYLYFAWQAERHPAEALGYAKACKQPLRVGLFPGKIQVMVAVDWATEKAKAKDGK
jgi:hypothetical protein